MRATVRRADAIAMACEELRAMLAMFQHNAEKRARLEAILSELER